MTRKLSRRTLALASALSAVIAASPVLAQTYPDRTITMIVPFAAGGAADVSGRIIGEGMSKHLGQTIVIENVAGAGGSTGSLRGKNAKPDGYTIGLGHMGTHGAALATNPKLPYDPRKDFDYLGIVNLTPNLMVARKDFPANNLKEFIAEAKKLGKDLKIAHNGIGSLSHLTCLQFFQLIGSEPTYVTYRGFGSVANDLLAAKIDGTCDLVASVSGHINGGSIKGFGITGTERSPVLPNIPTAKEEGLEGFTVQSWLGLYVPKGLPEPILAKLREVVEKALSDPEIVDKFAKIGGGVPKGDMRGPANMLKRVGYEVDVWTEAIKNAGGPPPPEEPAPAEPKKN
ncbi:MAG: Bug family tripartite tricarboxylate transporter substrate binding protein [Hyphomicrobiaceae bacterium]